MSLNTVRSHIESRIATEFATAPPISVAYQNVPFTPPNNASWIQASIIWGDSAYMTVFTTSSRGTGAGFDRRNGTLVFNIFAPRGAGPGAGLTIAQRCIDLFSRLQLENIKFDPANGPRTIEPSVPEGFSQTQVTISFEAYEQS
jgi:hypothetical protein